MAIFEKPDFIEVLQLLAEITKSRISNDLLTVDNSLAKGFAWYVQLPSDINVLVADLVPTIDIKIDRQEGEHNFFCLQFQEQSIEGEVKRKRSDDLQSFVKLSHTFTGDTMTFPADVHTRVVSFFFNKEHFSNILGKSVMDEMLNQHFPLLVQSNNLQPIATEYRVMLDELLVEQVRHPLRFNFIQNRVLLLLENFIFKLYHKPAATGKKVKRTDDETIRLMKVEALLVRNFEKPPPTIDELSRISAMSPTKLKNDFKALYGLPIYEYYQKNRMLKAKSLLLQAKYSIKEVGTMVGYSNLSHFANTFKKEFGYLPSELSSKDGVLVYNT